MSQFYNPNRSASWNYGGNSWKLSRSKIDLFLECPRCFYIDNKMGTKRPPGFPFNLNSAVDALFKKEFDIHRAKGTAHPLMEQYGVDAVPFEHPDIDEWRDNFKGVTYNHADTGMTVSGAVDDVWINPEGELIVVDYKSTSKDETIDALNADWHIGYKRQMEVYQWLLRQNGFPVSDTGYFVYANASTDEEAFDGRLEFEVTLIPYTGGDSWIEETLVQIKQCLTDERVPSPGSECDYCAYREAAGKKLLENKKKLLQHKTSEVTDSHIADSDTSKSKTSTLF
jgi:CRISPR/Cas system-associated exonuclease Cas4 (RecB family)